MYSTKNQVFSKKMVSKKGFFHRPGNAKDFGVGDAGAIGRGGLDQIFFHPAKE